VVADDDRVRLVRPGRPRPDQAAGRRLIADVPGLTSTPDQQRAVFTAWCDYLAADRRGERVDANGVTHLHAVFTWHDDPSVGGTVRAVLFLEEGSEPA
jgi:hypothetical protein